MEQTVVRIRTLEIGSGMPKICVPVVGKTEKEILEGAERAKCPPYIYNPWRPLCRRRLSACP